LSHFTNPVLCCFFQDSVSETICLRVASNLNPDLCLLSMWTLLSSTCHQLPHLYHQFRLIYSSACLMSPFVPLRVQRVKTKLIFITP
jgi:hypothetical protein